MMDLEEIKRPISAQASGIELQLGRNKWLSLIKKSMENNNMNEELK